MTSRSWIRRLFARTPRTVCKAPGRCRLAMEALEDRLAPALITVTSLADNLTVDGQVTLREAIQAAQTDAAVDGSTAGSGADAIVFAPGLTAGGPATINLSLVGDNSQGNSAFLVDTPITLQGTTGRNGITLRGPGSSGVLRHFLVNGPGNLTVANLTVSDGNVRVPETATRLANDGGSILLQPGGTVTVTNSTFANNTSADDGGAIRVASATLGVTNSTFSGNRQIGVGGQGGAIACVSGTVTLINSTVSGNSVETGLGGGIGVFGGAVTLTNCTVSGNGGGLVGGIFNQGGAVTLNNTIVANHSSQDVNHWTGSNNLFGSVPLGPLQNNGGPTQTHAVLTAAAIDAGNNSLVPAGVITDQRGPGFPRIVGSTVDIGAFELPHSAPTIARTQAAVTVNEGSPAGTTGTFDDPEGRDTVTLTASLGTVTKNDAAGTWSWSHTPADGPAGPTSVTITATDISGLMASITFTLTVTNVAPTIAISGAGSINEGTTYTLTLGAVTDPGSDAVTQYVVNWGDGRSDTYNSRGAKTHVYAGGGTKTITIDLVDEDGTHSNRANPVSVVVNAAPTDITLSNSSVAENQPVGTAVGAFSTTDLETGGTFAYNLVNGAGDADNASFGIDADGNLTTAASFDIETKSSYSIRVRSTDAGGLWVEEAFTISVNNVNEAPTVAVPSAQTAYEDVDQAINGITVGDPDGGSLTVTLAVGRGKLTLDTTTGLTVTGNGSGSVTLSGSIADLNAALAGLVYRGGLNYGGSDTLSITVSDGSLSEADSVAITVKSAAQQAADLQALVAALRDAGMLNRGQANALIVKLNLKGNGGDADKVQSFLDHVQEFCRDGILTQVQADALLGPGNVLLLSVMRR